MKMKIKRGQMFGVADILLILGIVLQGAGNFGFLPLNIAQLIIIMTGIILVFKHSALRIKITKVEMLLLVYMCLVTFIGTFDFECVKGLGFFAIQLIVLGIYYRSNKDLTKICNIIYTAAFVLAFIGLIQEIGYILGIPYLYDISLYGFTKNGSYTTSFGIIRVMSLYAEPSELSAVFSAGILIGLIGEKNSFEFSAKWKNVIIGIASLLTASFVVYVSIFVAIVYYVAVYQRLVFKKLLWGIASIVFVAIVIRFIPGIKVIITEKINSLISGSSTQGKDLSAFALYSNMQVAFEKMKSGYILGTGYDTHRLYYFNYIDRLYSTVVMYANVDEASSLYTRIFSEFGIVGLIAYIVFLVSRFRSYIKNKDYILQALIVVLFVSGIRNGHYVDILKMLAFSIVLNNRKAIVGKNSNY